MDKELPIVVTDRGRVQGCRWGSGYRFLGIPYAAPITGEARWLAPQPVSAWTGVRPAQSWGASCPQVRLPHSPLMRAAGRALAPLVLPNGLTEGDDCLNLNVWTPELGAHAKLPVIVVFHGGSGLVGSSAMPIYEGAGLAEKGAVVVTFNYRLGWLGQLAGDALFDGDFCPANRAALDQLAVLEWVQTNIRGFGGDPACVTAFGQSAGATALAPLLATPRARGLFHRAILHGGPSRQWAPLADHQRFTVAALQQLGIRPGDRQSLANTPNEAVFRATDKLNRTLFNKRAAERFGRIGEIGVHSGAITGTELFATDLLTAMAQGRANSVDLLVGTNAHESRIFSLLLSGPRLGMFLSWLVLRKLAGFASATWRSRVERTRDLMPGVPAYRWREVVLNEAVFREPATRLCELASSAGVGRTYMFRFDWCSPTYEEAGAVHALEMPFVLDQLEPFQELVGELVQAQSLADKLSTAWVKFATDGRPSAPGLPDWPEYDGQTRRTLVIGETQSVVADPGGELRRIFSQHPDATSFAPVSSVA